MDAGFINLTPENLDGEHLCCIIRSKKRIRRGSETAVAGGPLEGGPHFPQAERKGYGIHRIRPLETAWTPVLGDSYYYIYCLWVCGESKGKGYGRALMEYCLADARAKESPACMLGAEKQKAWLSDQAFAKKFGFQTVDTAPNGYELLALSFDGTKPRFAPHAKKATDRKQGADGLLQYAVPVYPSARGAGGTVLRGRTACRCPSSGWIRCKRRRSCLVFSTTGPYFTKRKFETVNLLDDAALQRLLKNEAGYPKGCPAFVRKKLEQALRSKRQSRRYGGSLLQRRRAGAESLVCARDFGVLFFRCIPINRDLVSGSLYNAIVNTTFSKPCILAASARQFFDNSLSDNRDFPSMSVGVSLPPIKTGR